MEPVILQPNFKEVGAVLGRQGVKQDKIFFPVVIHLCTAKGRKASDGWSLVCAVKSIGCQLLDPGSTAASRGHLEDSWVSDALERVAKKACANTPAEAKQSAGTGNSGKYVRWQVSTAFVYDEPIEIEAGLLSGKQMHPLQKMPEAIHALVVGQGGVWHSQESEASDSGPVQRGTCPRTWACGYLFRVPGAVAEQPLLLVTPVAFAQKLRVEPEGPSSAARGEDGLGSEAGEGHQLVGEPSSSSQRTPIQDILFSQMAYVLQSFAEMPAILNMCARILDPDGSQLQKGMPPVPNRESLRKSLIKLDLFLMLHRRVFHHPNSVGYHVHRFLSADASPQAHQNFFCAIEDVVRQPVNFRGSDGFNAFKEGFEVERRSLPALTLGKGAASAAHKARLLVHCACLEYGQDSLSTWRSQIVSFLSDQGVERNLCHYPVNLEGNLAEFLSSFSADAKAGSSQDPILFPLSFSVPGILHIMFNALEESILQIDEWKRMEQQLQAACHVVSEPHSQSLILDKLFKEASASDRATVEAFTAKLLNWRWQSLQEVVHQWFAVYPLIKDRWDPAVFPDESSKYVQLVTEALGSSWHYLFLSWLCMYTSVVGREATWFEGCFCHSELLASHNRWQRRKQMLAEQCPGGSCVWQGRRLPALALGHCKDLCRRVMNGGSWQYTMGLLDANRSEAQRIAEIDFLTKTKFCETTKKLEPFHTLPYVLAGAFGHYCGYSLAAAKDAVARGIAEYDALLPHNRDSVSASLLEHDAVVAMQLRHFAVTEDKPLHDYPDAFIAIRARAFALLTERHTEGEHARVKFHAQRGFRFAGPVVAAARKRWAEVQAMIRDHLHWLAEHWHTKTLFVTLLQHMLPQEEVHAMTFAQRCQRVYACHPKDHFADMSKWEKEADAFQKTVKKVQLSLEKSFKVLADEAMQMVFFIKHFLPNGTFASVPASLWRAGTLPSHAEGPDVPSASVLEKCLLSPKLPELHALQEHVFFSVVDAHPEAKVVVKTRKTRQPSTVLCVSFFPQVAWEGGGVKLTVEAREAVFLDVSAWVLPAEFETFCRDAVVWRASCSELQVNLNPALTSSEVPLTLPDFFGDDDPLESLLLYDASEERAIEFYQGKKHETGLSVDIAGRPITHDQQSTLMSLVDRRAFGAESACGVWDMSFYSSQAIQSLEALGLIKKETDELGDDHWWLADAGQIFPGMRLTEPACLLEEFHSPGCARQRSRRSCKLAFVLALLQDGWSMKGWKDNLIFFHKGRKKILCDQLWKRPEAYFKALLVHEILFERPGGADRIHHLAPASYYNDFLLAEDTSVFKKMTGEECLNYNKTKKARAKAKSGGRGKATSSRADVLADEDMLPLDDVERSLLQIPEGDLQLQSVGCKEPTMKDVVVHYDRFTHASGNLRAFTACVHHRACRRYVFVKNHGDRPTAEAWLFAWNALGARCGSPEEHKSTDPTEMEVAKMKRLQNLF